MCGHNVDFKIDTAADVSVMHVKAYEALRVKLTLETASICHQEELLVHLVSFKQKLDIVTRRISLE